MTNLNTTLVEETEPEITQADLDRWYELDSSLAVIKEKEMELRKRIFRFYFPTAKEGTNTEELPFNCKIKGHRNINRKVLPNALEAFKAELIKESVDLKNLIKYKPELSTTEYRKLTKEQLAIFDQCLEISDGAPAIEIVIPKSAKK